MVLSAGAALPVRSRLAAFLRRETHFSGVGFMSSKSFL